MALATRIAFREVKKRKGRTALVATLVALPLVAILLISTYINTTNLSSEQRFAREFGTASVAFDGYGFIPEGKQNQLRDVLKRNLGNETVFENYSFWSRPLLVNSSSVSENSRGKYVRIEERTSDAAIRKNVISLRSGRWASSQNEVAVSESLARTWKLSIGHSLMLEMPQLNLKVVGIIRTHYQLRDAVVFVPADSGLSVPNTRKTSRLLVQTSRPILETDLAEISRKTKYFDGDDDLKATFDMSILPSTYGSPAGILSWIAVMTVIALAVMAVLISAAFATSARRQLTTIGQLSANGAPGRLIQRALAWQGVWSGLGGVIVAAGIVASVLTLGKSRMDSLAGYSIGGIKIPVYEYVFAGCLAVVASMIAAWLPSRMAARTSVLDALAGRRGELPVRRSLLPLGLLLFGSGVGLEFLVALGVQNSTGNSDPFLVAGSIGGLLILAGVCCMGPVVISVFNKIGEKSSGVVRLMARGLARNRSRSAAVVVSIATFSGLGIAIAMGTTSGGQPYVNTYYPNNVVGVASEKCGDNYQGRPFECTPQRAKPEYEKSVLKILKTTGNVKQVSVDYAQPRNIDSNFFVQDQSGVDGELLTEKILVANSKILEFIKMSKRDLKNFNRVGIVYAFDPSMRKLYQPAGPYSAKDGLVVPLKTGVVRYPMYLLRDDAESWGRWRILITAKRAKEIGFTIFRDSARLFVAKANLSESQRVQIGFVRQIAAEADEKEMSAKDNEDPVWMPTTDFMYSDEFSQVSAQSVYAFVAGGLLLLVLIIVAIGLSLMSTEGKDERDVLLAVGANPSTLSKLAGLRAFWLSFLGLLIAIPVAVIPMSVVLKAGADPGTNPIRIPWSLFALLGTVPMIAYVVARFSSALAQIIRPIHVSNAQFE